MDFSFVLIFISYIVSACGVVAFMVYINKSDDPFAELVDIKREFKRAVIVASFTLVPALVATLAVFNSLTFMGGNGEPLYLERLFLVVTWTVFFYTVHRRMYESS